MDKKQKNLFTLVRNILDKPDYETIQKYFFRNFLITIRFRLTQNGKKEFRAILRNYKWAEIESIILDDEDERNLRKRVSSLLKKPYLGKEKPFLGEYSQNKLGIQVVKMSLPPDDYDPLEDNDPYEDNNPFNDYDYDSIDDIHPLEWNETEEEWSNDEE